MSNRRSTNTGGTSSRPPGRAYAGGDGRGSGRRQPALALIYFALVKVVLRRVDFVVTLGAGLRGPV